MDTGVGSVLVRWMIRLSPAAALIRGAPEADGTQLGLGVPSSLAQTKPHIGTVPPPGSVFVELSVWR